MIRSILWKRMLPWLLASPAGRQALRAAAGRVFDLVSSRRRQRPNRWKGLILGGVGGAAGTLAMGYYFKTVSAFVKQGASQQPNDKGSSAPQPLDDIALIGKQYAEGEGSTEALGRIIYQAVAGAAPESRETRTILSELVHWSFGTSMGALYGALRGPASMPDVAGGISFGASAWLFASELAVPLLGLSPGPTAVPLERHAKEFGAHLVYGLTVSSTTQALHRLL